jgi:hypothetical protein
MFVEFDTVALDLPGTAVFRGKTVLIGIVAFLKTPAEFPWRCQNRVRSRVFLTSGTKKG